MTNIGTGGIGIDGSSNLHLENTRIQGTGGLFGVAFGSPSGLLQATHCTEISQTYYGLAVGSGTLDLTLTPDQGTYLHDNAYSIDLNDASGLLLSGGENHLVPDPTSYYSYALYGSLNTSATFLAAHDNKWNTQSPNPSPPPGTPSPGTAPVFGTDYDLVNASGQPITLHANPIGQTVYTRKPWSAQAGTTLERLDLRQLPAGIYLLRLSVGAESYHQKIWLK